MIISLLTLIIGQPVSGTPHDSSLTVLSIYVVCLILVIGGVIFALSAFKVRTQVLRKHSEDMGKLDDWERAIKYAYSGNETLIITALDIFWALSNPGTYAEIQGIVALFANHSNKEISMRAQQIATKYQSSLGSTISTQRSSQDGEPQVM